MSIYISIHDCKQALQMDSLTDLCVHSLSTHANDDIDIILYTYEHDSLIKI